MISLGANVSDFDCRNYTLGVFYTRGEAEDVKHTVGLISIRYFDNKPILNTQSEAEDI